MTMNDFFGKREISIIIDYTHINCEIYMMIFVQTRSHLRSKMATTGRWQSLTAMHLTHPVISTVHKESSCWNKPNADVKDDYKHRQLQTTLYATRMHLRQQTAAWHQFKTT